MVNVMQLNRFRNEMVLLGEMTSVNKIVDVPGYGPNEDDNLIEGVNSFFGSSNNAIAFSSTDDDYSLSMTAMCYYKNSMVIYGGTHGKLHLVRLASLLT